VRSPWLVMRWYLLCGWAISWLLERKLR
jgi:hypothetical protein